MGIATRSRELAMLLVCGFGAPLIPFTALAQTTASLTGEVTDPDGAVVVGAKVTLVNAFRI